MPLLLNDAQTVDLQMRLVSENVLTKITRKQYSTIHGKLFELWGRYEDGEISTSKQAAEGLQCHHGTQPYCLSVCPVGIPTSDYVD